MLLKIITMAAHLLRNCSPHSFTFHWTDCMKAGFFSVWLTFSEMRNYTLKSSTLCVSCQRITRDHYPIFETQNYYRFINCFYWCKRSDNGTTCLTNRNYYNEVKCFNLFNDSCWQLLLIWDQRRNCKICCYPWYDWRLKGETINSRLPFAS